eukprot:snap_masked-scaffold_5-processed-gene-8.59-mRNA-1 protein AED:0.04 eAED:0.04 QI:0/-1/0/1/-1/1/1/0/442
MLENSSEEDTNSIYSSHDSSKSSSYRKIYDHEDLTCAAASKLPGFFPFLFLGVFNNSIFVILNSVAKEISSGGVALVYFFNSFPVLFIKVTGPYWFPYVSYQKRFLLCTVLFSSSLLLVALSSTLEFQLLGVFFSSAAGGIGEPTILALSSLVFTSSTERSKKNYLLTGFSSGTGIAGTFGYIWTLFFVVALNLSPSTSLILANIIPFSLFSTFFFFIKPILNGLNQEEQFLEEKTLTINEKQVSFSEKRTATFYLMKYMFPLFLVYAAEYTLQSGVWASIGFPINSMEARNSFYLRSNFLYQLGVFFSRSSAIILPLSLRAITLLPWIQVFLLILFTGATMSQGFFFNPFILTFLSFCSGLIGGAVYVNAFNLISVDEEINPSLREFSIAAATVADTVGIITADVLGLIFQGCLYGWNKILDEGKEPVFTCGYNFSSFDQS